MPTRKVEYHHNTSLSLFYPIPITQPNLHAYPTLRVCICVFRSTHPAHAQLDYAIKERGVNFVDTAEM